MIDSQQFLDNLKKNSIDFFTGVPDSLLKSFNACLFDHVPAERHIIAANEGAAVALATGYHLASNRLALVYLQNSGLGNAVNPLLSLADPEVYGIPMLLMIGWRGKPGIKDEPQHVKQGKVQNALLEGMEIPYRIINAQSSGYEHVISELADLAIEEQKPVALVVEKNTFLPYALRTEQSVSFGRMTREEAIETILLQVNDPDIVVSTTGMASRELYELRAARNQGHHRDFLTVGSMGHCSQIALAISLMHQNRHVFCLDGDGAVIMHMGSLSITGAQATNNFIHIILNNGAHDSVGGQPTAARTSDFVAVAKACGYKQAVRTTTGTQLEKAIKSAKTNGGPALIEAMVKPGARKDLGRPAKTPGENKIDFMKYLNPNHFP